MRWPPWSGDSSNNDARSGEDESLSSKIKSKASDIKDDIVATTSAAHLPTSTTTSSSSLLSTYTSPDVLIPTAVLTGTLLLGRRMFRRYLARIPDARRLEGSAFRGRSLLGRVTSVGDGDGFRFFHTPGGRLAGWGWFPAAWRRVPTSRAGLKEQTISVRLAGVDAPEAAHFGHPGQPGGQEAWDWLRAFLVGETVRIRVWRRDQYERAVATATRLRWGGLVRQDVGLAMLKRGLATVYEAKTGAEFGGREQRYRRAEAAAKRWRKGIWKDKEVETPREFKDKMKKLAK